MTAIGVVSADRRYVRVAAEPIISTIGDVQTFTFAGSSQSAAAVAVVSAESNAFRLRLRS